MFFLTDSELFYTYENLKSKKVHGTFGLGCKYQGRTVYKYNLKAHLQYF